MISSILPLAASLVGLVFQHDHVELFTYLVSVMFFVFVVIKTVVENYVHLDVWRTVSILVEAPYAFNLMLISDLSMFCKLWQQEMVGPRNYIN